MTYTSLLVHMEPGEEAEGRLHLACELAARFDALLIGIDAALLKMPILDPTGFAAVDPDLIAGERETLEAELADTAEKFRIAAAAKNLRTKWHSSLEFPADVICRHARAADLLIVGRGASAATVSPQHAADAAEILMRTGRPMLVVPPQSPSLRLEHVIVAWKDVREAQRAVADSIPLLQLAGKVSVVTVCPEAEAAAAREAAEDVVAYLGGHGVAATHAIRNASDDGVAEEIVRALEEMRGDLIVSGAYSRQPLRERVFGGATHDLLKKAPVACLLSH